MDFAHCAAFVGEKETAALRRRIPANQCVHAAPPSVYCTYPFIEKHGFFDENPTKRAKFAA
jgi:hypothetical protein